MQHDKGRFTVQFLYMFVIIVFLQVCNNISETYQ